MNIVRRIKFKYIAQLEAKFANKNGIEVGMTDECYKAGLCSSILLSLKQSSSNKIVSEDHMKNKTP